MTAPDTIVVGAGVIGASSAWHLARLGRQVTLIDDPAAPAASQVAAGMLAPVTEAEFGEESLLSLNLASSEMYPAFAEELVHATGQDIGYHRCGTLMVARDVDDVRVHDEVHAYQQKLGLEAQRLSGREARALEPTLAPGTRGGIFVPGDHQIDPPALVRALSLAVDSAGVERVQERVVSIRPGPGAVTVRLANGDELSCATVVIAAGSYSGAIAGFEEFAIPVRPVKGQLVHLRARREVTLPARNIRGVEVYLVCRPDGRVVVGATVEEQGFDTTLTARAVHELLRDAYELLPASVELEFVGATAGLRPATPDNAPAIGLVAPGVVVAVGHFRNGVLQAPITAKAVGELVEGRQPEYLGPFDPRRFASVEEGAR